MSHSLFDYYLLSTYSFMQLIINMQILHFIEFKLIQASSKELNWYLHHTHYNIHIYYILNPQYIVISINNSTCEKYHHKKYSVVKEKCGMLYDPI